MDVTRPDVPNGVPIFPLELTLEDRLIHRKYSLEFELDNVKKALEALQSNPELRKALSLISKAGY